MAESSDPLLLTKRATKGAGASAVPGVCMISRSRVRWQPNAPEAAQALTILLECITSECACVCV